MHKLFLLALTLFLFMTGCTRDSEPAYVPAPIADFAASTAEGAVPLTIIFTDLSTGDINRWHWDFGDGHFSDLPQPSHIYTEAGQYTVSLAIMGTGGSDSETKIEYIKVDTGIISWEEAANHIGQNKVVEGTIVGSHYSADLESQPTFLDFHKPYKGYFKCIIWGRYRQKFVQAFPPNPETYFLNKHVQVTGLIEEYPKTSGIPEIVLRDPAQIKVIAEQPAP